MSVALVEAPPDLDRAFLEGHELVRVDVADAAPAFVRDRMALQLATEELVAAAGRGTLTWVAYPKPGQLGTDLNRDVIRTALEARGTLTVRQVALDDVGSALRLRAV
jgi:hypothetical protein